MYNQYLEELKDQARKEVQNLFKLSFSNSDIKKSIKVRIFGSLLIAISGLILYLDKFMLLINYEGTNSFGYDLYYDFIWALTQSVSPILMIFGSVFFRPYNFTYLIAIYCYSIQILWVLHPEYYDDIGLTIKYSFGLFVAIIFVFSLIGIAILSFLQKKTEDERFVESAREALSLLKEQVLANQA